MTGDPETDTEAVGQDDSSSPFDDTDEGSGASDVDGDGYSVEDGDCNDEDPSVSPGAVDDCDGVDSDCDGELDEDSVSDDGYEPNDTSAWTLGTLSDEDSFILAGTLHNDGDVDLFEVHIDDKATNWFTLEVALSDIPDQAIFELELLWVNDSETLYLDSGSGSLETAVEDASLVDETGDYRIAVRSLGGADCAEPYSLQIDYLEWGW